MSSDIKKQIIAFGDGGLDGNNPFIDLYTLAQSNKKNPKVCLLPTASGDNNGLIKYFYQLYNNFPCETSHLSLFNPHTKDIRDFLLSQDVIFVSGGHTKSMISLWKAWDVDKFLIEAYNNGTVLAGSSAGSVCWFDQCITDSIPGSLTVMNCLGILPYSNCPHYTSTFRQYSYSKYIKTKEIKAGYAADDNAGLHFVNGKLIRSVSNEKYAKTYKIFLFEDKVIQKRLKTHYLNNNENQEKLIFSCPAFSYLKKEKPIEKEEISTEIIPFIESP